LVAESAGESLDAAEVFGSHGFGGLDLAELWLICRTERG
jgi:hypothetical protein